ncbi:MAG: MltA domain-containing protein [Desulfobacteraceae bacterium]
MRHKIKWLSILFFALILNSCHPALQEEAASPEEALVLVRFFYPDFFDDMDLGSLEQAAVKNLEYLNRVAQNQTFKYGPHEYSRDQVIETQKTLLEILEKNKDPKEIKKKIKEDFLLYRAAGRAGKKGVLFSGYFEPIYNARLSPDDEYKFPIYSLPEDLIKIDLSLFKDRYKGESIIARYEEKQVLPYFTRMEIENQKVLKNKKLEIAWLKDPIDVAFLHIQGSGRLQTADGDHLSVGYNSSNGRPYKSIGKYLIEKEYMTREEMSMQGIRSYLSMHPDIIEDTLNYNPSYIFFRVLENGPLGNIRVPLTPGRSIALDSRLFPKGALCFIRSEKPVENSNGEIEKWEKFSRFIINQDTGGAITGAGRADIFWGNGKYAELAAGHMKHEGELFVLIKKQ